MHKHPPELESRTEHWLWRIFWSIIYCLIFLIISAHLGPRLEGNKPPPPQRAAWRQFTWVSDQVTLVPLPGDPVTVAIDGLPNGPLLLLIDREEGNRIEVRVQCTEHGGVVGSAILELMPNNLIRLLIVFTDGADKEIVFRHRPSA